MKGSMMKIDYSSMERQENFTHFYHLLLSQGASTFGNGVLNILGNIIADINNQYSYADYHYIFDTNTDSECEYANILFKYICAIASRTDLSYIEFFFRNYVTEEGLNREIYDPVPAYRRLMRKKQSGKDEHTGSVNLKNSNSPINADPEVINPTSKSQSSSDSTVKYGNITDYDNINETETINYYKNLENLYTWVRKHLIVPLIFEHQINNY